MCEHHYCRKSVRDFAEAMEAVLRKNDYKGGWDECTTEHLQARLVEELGEYFHETLVSDGKERKELVDIANFCMMLHERF